MARASESRKRPIGTRLAALLVMLVLSACRPEAAADKAAPPASTLETLRVGMMVWPGYYPALVAEARGLDRTHGLDLEVQVAADTTELLAEFAAGRHEVIAVPLANALLLGQQRPDTVIILVTNESLGGDVLLQAAGFEPGQDGPVRLGTHLGGFGELLMADYLARQGIPPARWVWVDTPSADVPEAFARDRIDIGLTWEPYLGEARATGAVPVFTSADTPGLVIDVCVTTQATLAQRPEALRRFIDAWFDAADDWSAHPDVVAPLLAQRLGVPQADISLEGVRLFSREDNRKAFTTKAEDGDALLLSAAVARYSGHFVERGSLSAPADMATLMSGGSLHAPRTEDE